MNKLLSAFAVLTCLLMVSSCQQLTSQVATSTEGRDFSIEAMKAIPVGASEEDVLQQFGEPTEKTTLDDGTDLWIYVFAEVTARGYSDGSSEIERQHVKTGSVFLKDGKVTKVTAVEEVKEGE